MGDGGGRLGGYSGCSDCGYNYGGGGGGGGSGGGVGGDEYAT